MCLGHYINHTSVSIVIIFITVFHAQHLADTNPHLWASASLSLCVCTSVCVCVWACMCGVCALKCLHAVHAYVCDDMFMYFVYIWCMCTWGGGGLQGHVRSYLLFMKVAAAVCSSVREIPNGASGHAACLGRHRPHGSHLNRSHLFRCDPCNLTVLFNVTQGGQMQLQTADQIKVSRGTCWKLTCGEKQVILGVALLLRGIQYASIFSDTMWP